MAIAWEVGVFSTNAQAIGYDPDTKEMFVTWNSGRRSAYAGVPEEVAIECSKAASVGQYLNREIKPNFSHRYV
jgi:hypothetical protein